MKIGVVGLGLMGGSLARALKKYTSHTVCGVDTDPKTLKAAYDAGAIDCDSDVSGCDIVFVCLFPQGSIDYMPVSYTHLYTGTSGRCLHKWTSSLSH